MTGYPGGNKSLYVERTRAHMAPYELVRSIGWKNGRDSTVGYTPRPYSREVFAHEIGVPEPIVYTVEALSENLPAPEWHKWGPDFLEAVQEGRDYTWLWHDWAACMLGRCLERVGNGEERWRVACCKAVKRVRLLCIEHAPLDDERWYETELTLRDAPPTLPLATTAAAKEAVRAAEHVAETAGSGMVEAAAWAAEAAALAAAGLPRCQAARDAELRAQRDDLLRLLRGETSRP